MAKLEHFRDLFKYASELFDDDYNKNKALVVKVKSKSVDGLTVSNAAFSYLYHANQTELLT
jgi:ribosomal protein S17E